MKDKKNYTWPLFDGHKKFAELREQSNQLLQTALIDFPDVLLPLLGKHLFGLIIYNVQDIEDLYIPRQVQHRAG